jgi:hypothetical protein
MCVHVYDAFEMPDSTLVWVDRRGPHTLVYADRSLSDTSGNLTPAGVNTVNEALGTLPGTLSLETAKSCV